MRSIIFSFLLITFFPISGYGQFKKAHIISKWNEGTTEMKFADFNQDGKTDLVTITRTFPKKIVIHLSSTGNNFIPKTVYIDSLGFFSLRCLSTGDFDADGDLDIVSINSYSSPRKSQVLFFQNDGEGGFSDLREINLKDRAFVSYVDIDNDSDIDIIANSYWYINDGSGVFKEQHNINDKIKSDKSKILVDVDGDNDLDFIVFEEDPSKKKPKYALEKRKMQLVWYENIQGNFTASYKKIRARFLRNTKLLTGDIDSDGRDNDIICVSDDGIILILNKGNGRFSQPQSIFDGKDNLYRHQLADFDNDGDEDIICQDYSVYQDKVLVYENIGNSEFTLPREIFSNKTRSSSSEIKLIDFNQDGKKDLITKNNAVETFISEENKSFSKKLSISSKIDFFHQGKIIAEDLDLDGKVDIIVEGINSIGWYKNLSNGNFSLLKILSQGRLYNPSIQIADIDQNGYPDIVTTHQGFHSISYYLNKGNGIFSGPIRIDELPVKQGEEPIRVKFALADMNSDSRIDLICSHYRGVFLYENKGGNNFTKGICKK